MISLLWESFGFLIAEALLVVFRFWYISSRLGYPYSNNIDSKTTSTETILDDLESIK